MKVFEKWWRSIPRYDSAMSYKDAEEVWKAVLEWLMKEIELHDVPINCEWMGIDEVKQIIKEELEEK